MAVAVALCAPVSTAFADTPLAQVQPAASAPVNPFAPRQQPAQAASSSKASLAPPQLPPEKYSSAKLPALPLPPPPEIPLPTFDGAGHAQATATPTPTGSEEPTTIGRARQAANCHLAMQRKDATAPATGGTVTLNFVARTAKDCAKAAMPDEDWIDVSNLGDRSISLEVKENDSGDVRVGHVRVVSPDLGDAINVTITQKPDLSGAGQ